jgi:5'-phosphate synthase pdxT subunit
VAAVPVKTPAQLAEVDALVIPGGESTTIGKMATRFGLIEPLRESIDEGLPTYGTCAGLILLAGAVTEGDQPLIGALDVVVRRNAFGRQNESFEVDLEVSGLDRPFHAVFIRAPWVEKVGGEVEVLAQVDDHPVMVRQGNILATSFHPELTGDARIHRMLLGMT